jgi:hypothetical protein
MNDNNNLNFSSTLNKTVQKENNLKKNSLENNSVNTQLRNKIFVTTPQSSYAIIASQAAAAAKMQRNNTNFVTNRAYNNLGFLESSNTNVFIFKSLFFKIN